MAASVHIKLLLVLETHGSHQRIIDNYRLQKILFGSAGCATDVAGNEVRELKDLLGEENGGGDWRLTWPPAKGSHQN